MHGDDDVHTAKWFMSLAKTLIWILLGAALITDRRKFCDAFISYFSMLSLWPLTVGFMLYAAHRSPARFAVAYLTIFLLTFRKNARNTGLGIWSQLGGGWTGDSIRRFLQAKIQIPYLLEIQSLAAEGKRFVFAVHPHAVFATSTLVHFVLSRLSTKEKLGGNIDFRVMTINLNFFIPLLREWLLARGFVSADPETIGCLASRGISTVVVPGGSEEALHAYEGSADLIVKKRRGFIREALKAGSWLVPIYAFGDTESVPVVRSEKILRVQRCIQKAITFATPFALPYFSRRSPLIMVVGAPLPPPISGTLEDRVDIYQRDYLNALKNLFNEYVHTYGTASEKRGRGIRFVK